MKFKVVIHTLPKSTVYLTWNLINILQSMLCSVFRNQFPASNLNRTFLIGPTPESCQPEPSLPPTVANPIEVKKVVQNNAGFHQLREFHPPRVPGIPPHWTCVLWLLYLLHEEASYSCPKSAVNRTEHMDNHPWLCTFSHVPIHFKPQTTHPHASSSPSCDTAPSHLHCYIIEYFAKIEFAQLLIHKAAGHPRHHTTQPSKHFPKKTSQTLSLFLRIHCGHSTGLFHCVTFVWWLWK